MANDHTSPSNPLEAAISELSSRRLPMLAMIAMILFSGVVHGVLDGRWAHPQDLKTQGERLAELPNRFGDWVLTESTPLEEGAAKLLRCYGSQVRMYRNEKTQASVNVAVLFGPRGPIAVHTPEICYSSIGTEQIGPAQPQAISTATTEHQLWSVQFSQDSQPNPSLDVWYGWSDGGVFQASNYPRFWMTENLYKIQVAGSVSSETDQPCREFLEAFLPHLERVIQS